MQLFQERCDKMERFMFFSSQKLISQPQVTQTPRFVAADGVDPLDFHVIIELGHVSAPFVIKIDQMYPKRAFIEHIMRASLHLSENIWIGSVITCFQYL